jgi:hypothetical protein
VSSSTETDPDTQVWGSEIEQVDLGGVSFRMYTQRPRRLGGLLDYAARWAEKPHIVQGERVVTFADVRAAAASKSAELAGQGIGAGDRVFILGFNSPEWVINFWAIVSLGAVPVLGRPRGGGPRPGPCGPVGRRERPSGHHLHIRYRGSPESRCAVPPFASGGVADAAPHHPPVAPSGT